LLSTALGFLDGVLNVQWGEHLLEQVAIRWQAKLVRLDQSIACLEQEKKQIEVEMEALALHAATLYLGARSLTCDRLRFDPSDPHDEEILDATIDLLVKQRLVAIEPVEIATGRYVYDLEPDWPSIRDRLASAIEQIEPETAAWFLEGLKLIDEELVAKAGN
jgi:hypothetical protein